MNRVQRTPLHSNLVDSATAIIATLSPLASFLRYLDEYDDTLRVIRNPSTSDTWPLVWDGQRRNLKMSFINEPILKFFLKSFTAWLLAQSAPATVSYHFDNFRKIYLERNAEWFLEAIVRPPNKWLTFWDLNVAPDEDVGRATTIKSLLHFLCDTCTGGWSPDHRQALRSLHVGKDTSFLGVADGSSLLKADEEAAVIEALDECSALLAGGHKLTNKQLLNHCLLAISYEHGLRPVQIARINLSDLRTYVGEQGEPIVHFTAYRAKKRTSKDKMPFTRRIKRDWAPPFVEYHRRQMALVAAKGEAICSSDKAFTLGSSRLAHRIGDVAEGIIGNRRTATDFRHSAAQRLADAGATIEEVAEFLGHSYFDTSLVYFESSAAQAELINRALAISPIYSEIIKVARTRVIDKDKLLGLLPEHQIGAIPHGIPIAGIGACNLGQSLCALNPVLSCYTCRKFIPMDDADLHREVLESLRGVVLLFFDESRGDRQSPAYVQLRATLEAIQKVIAEISSVANSDREFA